MFGMFCVMEVHLTRIFFIASHMYSSLCRHPAAYGYIRPFSAYTCASYHSLISSGLKVYLALQKKKSHLWYLE